MSANIDLRLNGYLYAALPTRSSIRILKLRPGPPYPCSEPVVLSIEVVDLDNEPDFEAVSYTWYHPSPGNCIEWSHVTVDGQRMQLTAELEYMFKHLRYTKETRTLWVDAICINQASVPEKNAQVAQMSRVYEQARQVVVWLGGGSPGSSDAMFFLNMFAEFPGEEVLGKDITTWCLEDNGLDASGVMRLFKVCNMFGVSLYDKGSEVLGIEWREYMNNDSGIARRPWWQRVWVLQEVVMAKKDPLLVCGNACISFESYHSGAERLLLSVDGDQVYVALLNICADDDLYDDIVSELQSWNKLLEQPEDERLNSRDLNAVLFYPIRQYRLKSPDHRVPLAHILRTTPTLRCFDPRDQIFGLFSMLPEKEQDPKYGLVPNYDPKFSAEQLYHKASAMIFRLHGALAFSLLSFRHSRKDGFPTWVHDFRPEINGLENPYDTGKLYESADASGEKSISPPKVDVTEDLREITADCLVLDVLEEILEVTFNQKETSGLDNEKVIEPRDLKEKQNAYLRESYLIMKYYKKVDEMSLRAKSKTVLAPWRADLKTKHHISSVLVAGSDFHDTSEYETMYEVLCGRLSVPNDFRGSLEEDDPRDPWKDHIPEPVREFTSPLRKEMEDSVAHRTFFSTKEGFIGVSVPGAKPEDIVALPIGSKAPMVMRPFSGYYELIGGAYVSGIMHGELVELFDKKLVKPASLSIQ